jgi:hypothetical protein
MMALSAGLNGIGHPLVLAVLIALVVGALEGERRWVRARRRRGLGPGAIAYMLDGLVLASTVLVLVGAAWLFAEGMTSIASVVGGVIQGERVGLLIVGMALALGLALALGRAASGRRAAQLASTTAAALPANLAGPSATETRLAIASEQPIAYASAPYEPSENQPLAMLQERWRPGAVSAASAPTSFLDLQDSHPNKPERSRFALASTLLVLALMVLVVSGALLFRHQLMNILAGMDASYGRVISATSVVPPSQPDTSAEVTAADAGAAAALVVSAPPAAEDAIAPTVAAAASEPTAASLAAPLPANDRQAAQKRVRSNSLNVRAQPGTDQQVVLVLAQGDSVTVLNDARLIQGATWIKVRAGDVEGWVDQSLLE